MINLLRDFRKQTPYGWVGNDGYIAFLEQFPKLEKIIRDNEQIIREALGMDAEDFMRELSKKRPATNFNPKNKLGKKRPYWTRPQIERLKRVSGL